MDGSSLFHVYLNMNCSGCKDAGILPVFVSLPHFLGADPSFMDMFRVGGLNWIAAALSLKFDKYVAYFNSKLWFKTDNCEIKFASSGIFFAWVSKEETKRDYFSFPLFLFSLLLCNYESIFHLWPVLRINIIYNHCCGSISFITTVADP